MKVKNKTPYILLSAALLLTIMFVFSAISFSTFGVGASTPAKVKYGSAVCNHVTRADGTVEELGCSHNTVTDLGLDGIQDYLMTGGGTAFDYIALCNASIVCNASAAGSVTLDSEVAGCGMDRAQGTTAELGTGNWSVYKEFTSTCNGFITNKTGLFNDSADDRLLAENTFTLVTLQNNDKLTINWTIFVENG